MQSRTFLRIEGDLVSLVSEVIDREVALPDLLAELTTTQVHLSPRLPTGCRFWLRAGSTGRTVFVTEQAPMLGRVIREHDRAAARSDRVVDPHGHNTPGASRPSTSSARGPRPPTSIWSSGASSSGVSSSDHRAAGTTSPLPLFRAYVRRRANLTPLGVIRGK